MFRKFALLTTILLVLTGCGFDGDSVAMSNISNLGAGRYSASCGSVECAVDFGRRFCAKYSLGNFVADTVTPSGGWLANVTFVSLGNVRSR